MSDSHITIGPSGRFQCEHCGATYNPHQPPGAQFKLTAVPVWAYVALQKGFTQEHRDCAKPQSPLCHFCFSQHHSSDQHVNVTTLTPSEWIVCGDTGISSKAIWAHMATGKAPDPGYPRDPDDFGRCFRLLNAPWASEWRTRIGEMKIYSPQWNWLVENWDELEALYREEYPTGKCPRLYARMTELRGKS